MTVASAMGVDCKVNHLAPRTEVKVAFSDHSRVVRVFGKHDKTQLKDGIGRMAEWARRHGSRESNIFKDIEILKNMPQSWALVAKQGRRR